MAPLDDDEEQKEDVLRNGEAFELALKLKLRKNEASLGYYRTQVEAFLE